MIPVTRLDEPRVLAEHKEEWTRAFLEKHAEDPNARPRSERYAHREVKATLAAMSHHKCFYCEGSTKDEAPEVDHHVEVARRPDHPREGRVESWSEYDQEILAGSRGAGSQAPAQASVAVQVVKAIDDARIRDGGRAMTAAELELLRRFAQPDAPFSLMCRHRLDSLLG